MNSVCRSFVLDTCGEVTTALKRAFMLQPVVEGRSVQVVLGGDSNGRTTRLLEAYFRLVNRVLSVIREFGGAGTDFVPGQGTLA